MKLVQRFLLLLLAMTTLCLSSDDKISESKSTTSRKKSVSDKEENEGELILVDDMWLDRDELDWEEVGGREGRHGVKSKKRLWPKEKVTYEVTAFKNVLRYKISKAFKKEQRKTIKEALKELKKDLNPASFSKKYATLPNTRLLS